MTAKTGGYLALAGRITQILMDIDRIIQRAELLLTVILGPCKIW